MDTLKNFNYTGPSIPTGFYTYVESEDISYMQGTFDNICSSLGYSYGSGYASTPVRVGLYNGSIYILHMGFQLVNQSWNVYKKFVVFVVSNPQSGYVDEYFVTNMQNTCQYSFQNGQAMYPMFMDTNMFINQFNALSSNCGVTYDSYVADLYTHKETIQ